MTLQNDLRQIVALCDAARGGHDIDAELLHSLYLRHEDLLRQAIKRREPLLCRIVNAFRRPTTDDLSNDAIRWAASHLLS